MKSAWMGFLSLLAASAVLAGPPSARGQSGSDVGPASDVTSVGSREARPVPRLRDTLRQPFGGTEDVDKPYRLSAQERQRLREQLRDESLSGSYRKP